MLRGGRAHDNSFNGWHFLYRRCVSEDLIGDRLNPNRIPYDNTSVNWCKYSKPWDVIFDDPGHGITCLMVCDLPKELPKEQPPGTPIAPHSFVAEHDPDDDNYSHSQIVTYKSGKKIAGRVSLSNTVKKELRTMLSDRSRVLLTPKI